MQGQALAQQHKLAQCCLGMNCSSHAQQRNIVPFVIYYPEHRWLMPRRAFGTPPHTASYLGTQLPLDRGSRSYLRTGAGHSRVKT